MTDDLVARLRSYNPPDRTIDDQRRISQDISDAADEIERLRGEVALAIAGWNQAKQRAEKAEAERDALAAAIGWASGIRNNETMKEKP